MVVWSWTRSLAGAGLFAHQSELCWSDRRWGHVDRAQSDNVAHSCGGFVSVFGHLQTVQGAELWGSFLLFSLLMLFMWELTILVLFGILGACWMIAIVLRLLNLLLMVTFLFLFAGRDTVRITEVKGHADEVLFLMVGFVSLTGLATVLQMKLLTLVRGGSVLLLSMLVVICLGFVVGGILLFLACIGSSLP